MRRERLKVCTGRIRSLEIYGHDSDEPLKNAIMEDICQYFGDTDGSDVENRDRKAQYRLFLGYDERQKAMKTTFAYKKSAGKLLRSRPR